jgi:hypothetical protein
MGQILGFPVEKYMVHNNLPSTTVQAWDDDVTCTITQQQQTTVLVVLKYLFTP